MMEEEHRAAERAADEAMAELLAEELEAKRKCDSGREVGSSGFG